jgi:hypothetical protein
MPALSIRPLPNQRTAFFNGIGPLRDVQRVRRCGVVIGARPRGWAPFLSETNTLCTLSGWRFVRNRGAPDSLGVGSGFEIESLRELGRVKKVLRIALIQHLVGLANI